MFVKIYRTLMVLAVLFCFAVSANAQAESFVSLSLKEKTVTAPNGAVTTADALAINKIMGADKKEVDEIAKGVYHIRGWGIAHTIAIDAPDGWIIVDTGDSTRAAAEMRQKLEQAVEEADGLLDTFNALLRIARIESGRRRQAFAAVDLGPLIDDVAELYAPLLEEAGLDFEARHQGESEVIGDRDLLFQATANLVDNALKHVPAGGRVSLMVVKGAEGVRLVVADDGPGIPEAERDRALERFYRLDSSRSTPGAGLGLSLVAAVAELHEARLELLDNTPGLRVELIFPASQSGP